MAARCAWWLSRGGGSGVSHITCTLISAALNLICCVPSCSLISPATIQTNKAATPLITLNISALFHSPLLICCRPFGQRWCLTFVLYSGNACAVWKLQGCEAIQRRWLKTERTSAPGPAPTCKQWTSTFFHLSVPSFQLHALCWTVHWQVCRKD